MEIMVDGNAAVKEMEAASVAWVGQLYKKPVLCIKVRGRAKSKRVPACGCGHACVCTGGGARACSNAV